MSGNDGTSIQRGNQIENSDTPSVVDPNSQHVPANGGGSQVGPSDLDIAINSAIINYSNCMKLKGNFGNNSVNNFKKKEVQKSALIDELIGPIEDEEEWLTVIFNYAMESDQDIIKNSIKQLIEDFKRKKLVIPQYLKQILGQMTYIERIIDFFSPTKPKIISKTNLDENPTAPHKSVQ